MKTLSDFENENLDLQKLEMLNTIGGLDAGPPERTITPPDNSNWNCGDETVCYYISPGNSICLTTNLHLRSYST